MTENKMVCIVCPKGCRLTVTGNDGEYTVSGHSCARGIEYGKNELLNPLRTLTSTVKISGAAHGRLPVKTSGPIPKAMIMTAVDMLDNIEVCAPVCCGDVIMQNILGTGIDFVATRDL